MGLAEAIGEDIVLRVEMGGESEDEEFVIEERLSCQASPGLRP